MSLRKSATVYNACNNETCYEHILASNKEKDGEGSFDRAADYRSRSENPSSGALLSQTHLFNVTMIKSPRSGPQYIASCSPPQSKSFSRAMMVMKLTESTFVSP